MTPNPVMVSILPLFREVLASGRHTDDTLTLRVKGDFSLSTAMSLCCEVDRV